MCAPCLSTLSLMGISLAGPVNALRLVCVHVAARAKPAASSWPPILEHYEADSAEMVLICPVLVIDAASNGFRAVVEQIIMQLPVAWAKLLLFEEQRVVHERQRVEHVEFRPLGKDQCVMDELVQTLLRGGLVKWRSKANFGTIVEEISDPDYLVSWVVDDCGL